MNEYINKFLENHSKYQKEVIKIRHEPKRV